MLRVDVDNERIPLMDSTNSRKCDKVIVVDVDGTLIPNVIDWDRLRERVAQILGINRERLRPLAESLAKLKIDEDLKKRAFEVIDYEELLSLDKVKAEDLKDNVVALARARTNRFCIVLVTLRSSRSVSKLLEIMKIDVDAVITRDIVCSRKEQLMLIKSRYSDARCMVFIGDTIYDLEASRSASIPMIVVHSWKELPKAIDKAIRLCWDEARHRSY